MSLFRKFVLRKRIVLLFALIVAGCAYNNTGEAESDAPVSNHTTDSNTPSVIRILALGDSLTLGYGSGVEGTGSEPGYRLQLHQLLIAEEISIDFVGSQNNGLPYAGGP